MAAGTDLSVLQLMVPLVAGLSDDELSVTTPCAGWAVVDLLEHMNVEHEAIVAPVLGGAHLDSDPRAAFEASADRWCAAFADMDPRGSVLVPKFGEHFPVGVVLDIHLADMVAHTWDLTVATGRPWPVPDPVVVEAARIAEVMIADTGELRGPKGYGPALPGPPDASPLERLLRRLGRDPAWQAPR